MNRSIISLLACCGLLGVASLVGGCGPEPQAESENRTIITTLPVLRLIIEPVATDFEIEVLLKNGQSPHGFQVTPSQAKLLSKTPLLVYAHPVIDGWAAELATKGVLPLWNNDHDEDAHYWTDPVDVQDAVNVLSDTLCSMYPDDCPAFRTRADLFSARIDSVYNEITGVLEPIKNECFLVSHPFMTRFLDRFGIRNIGPIQPLPGHDASPRTLSSMMEDARESACSTLLVQRAVDNRAMNALAADLAINVKVVDPLGTDEVTFESYLGSLARALLPDNE